MTLLKVGFITLFKLLNDNQCSSTRQTRDLKVRQILTPLLSGLGNWVRDLDLLILYIILIVQIRKPWKFDNFVHEFLAEST